jgi:hypothetical protein
MTCPHNNAPCLICWMRWPCKLNTEFVFLIKHPKIKWKDPTLIKKVKNKNGRVYTYFYSRAEMNEKRRLKKLSCINGENK